MRSPISTVGGVYRLLENVVPSKGPNDYGMLATCDANAVACVRTVILRGFDPQHHQLWINTHIKTAKVLHLRHNPDAEVCLWLARKQIQLRLRAEWRVVDAALAARMNLQEMYGQAWEDQPVYGRKLYGAVEEGEIPKSFAVLLGTLYRIDALRLRRPPAYEQYIHERPRSTWQSQRVT